MDPAFNLGKEWIRRGFRNPPSPGTSDERANHGIQGVVGPPYQRFKIAEVQPGGGELQLVN